MAPSKPHASAARPVTRQARALPGLLLAWYDAERRDLPWRRTQDPYAILVSEFMLQQTQVATAVPYFERFMATFPTVKALAAAPEQEVLRLWAGLGYYSRARNLRAAAHRIVEQYGGRVPPRVSDLLFLPGVGNYVAGAVASIAFGVAAPAVDTNVSRVLSRVFTLTADPTAPKARRELESLAASLIPAERPGDFNQAMMELGARVCTAAKPLCPECPLRNLCKAAEEGNPLGYPAQTKRPDTVEVEEAVAVVRDDSERYLIVQRPGDSGRYRGMWEFPHVVLWQGNEAPGKAKRNVRGNAQGEDTARKILETFLSENFGVAARTDEEWAEIRHQVTHHKIRKRVFLAHIAHSVQAPHSIRRSGAASAPSPNISEGDSIDLRWATLGEIAELPLGAPHKRILALLQESEGLFSL
jgi:A/G-specific adenine glycosylase